MHRPSAMLHPWRIRPQYTSRTRHSYSRRYSTDQTPTQPKGKSPHAQWYADILPGMIPIAILGSAIYLGLQLTHARLSHEKYMDEARQRVKELEAEVEALREEKRRREAVIPNKKGPRWLWSTQA